MNEPRAPATEVDTSADVEVVVQSRLTALSTVGVVMAATGIVSLAVGLILFLVAFPDRWYGIGTETATARTFVEATVAAGGLGLLLILLGSTLFFYGRGVLGVGSVEHFEGRQGVEQHD